MEFPLKNSGIAVIPTDTIYGIVAKARDRKAVARLYVLRRTTPGKPFIILIRDTRDLSMFGIKLTASQQEFLRTVWPGKVSVILPCPVKKFSYLHQGTKALAFRVPDSKMLQILLEETGPLVAPSANPDGKKPAETITEAKKYFGDEVDIYVNAGRRLKGQPSTLVSYTSSQPSIVRQGVAKVQV